MRMSEAGNDAEKADRPLTTETDTVAPPEMQAQASRPVTPASEPCARGGNLRFLWVYSVLVGSLLLRASVLDFESGDYKAFLGKWYDYFVEHGGLAAFKDDFTRYPLLYLYVVSVSTLLPLPKLYAIKLFSVLCDYVAAWFVFRIVRCKFDQGPWPWLAAGVALFLPTVWLNSAVWGQCDGMFTSALLAALFYVVVKRPLAAMVAFGLACALKPLAIYFAPFLAGWFFRERVPWKYVAVPPLLYAACGVPAILAGKPVFEVLFRWTQHRNIPELTLGATNWYQWVSKESYEVFFMAGIVLALAASACLVLAMQERAVADRERFLVATAVLSVLVVPYFLPGMHERYFYTADLISLIYAFFVTRGWIVAVLVQFCSFFAYLPYLFRLEPVPRPLLAVVMSIALGLVAVEVAKSLLRGPRSSGKEREPV